MTKYVKDLQCELKRAVATMERLNNDSRGRKMTDSEKTKFGAAENAANELSAKITNARAGARDVMPKARRDKRRTIADDQFSRYLRTGKSEIRADGTGMSTEPNTGGMSAGATGNDAGYMIPQAFWQNLQIAMKAYGGVSNDFKYVQTTTGAPMPWPAVDPTSVTGTWLTGENNQLAMQQPYQFGQGMLNGYTLCVGPFSASLQLVQDSAFDVDQFVADRIGEALGRSVASIAISGTGSGQPLGLVTALAAKSSTGTVGTGTIAATGGFLTLATASTVKTLSGSNPTEIVGNILSPATLLAMIQSVDPAYRNAPDGTPTAKYYVNDAQLAGLRNLVDNYGRPLLILPNQGGLPTLWGYPVAVDNNITNLTANTASGPIFGNLSAAMVFRVARGDSSIVAETGGAMMKLTERYADYLQVGYIGYLRGDIRSNDLRAAVVCQPAAT